ncbi:MAG TPA: hypothetical protein VFA18_10845, partial [Gemmataceae bacterium]|nr:hypothetical protein [Gemmataceae bacterium]
PRNLRAGSTVWKVTRPDWRLSLRPHLTVAGSGPVRLFLCDQTAQVVDGQHWIHEADCLLYHESDTDLRITLPKGAHLVEAAVDGQPSTSTQPQTGAVRVSLAGRWGVRRLRLRWRFDEQDEPLDRPRLDRPRLADITDGPSLWTVYAPADFLVNSGAEASQAASADAAEADLTRARAELELSGVLAQGLPLDRARFTQQLRASQERFAWCCAQADRHGRATPARTSELARLRQGNRRLAESRGFERLREQAEQAVERQEIASLPAVPRASGFPSRWTGPSEAAPPALHLVARNIEQHEQAIALSAVLIVALSLVGIAWHVPGTDTWARRLWPEQLALVGLIGWFFAPAAWVFLLLLLAGMVGRLAQIGMQLWGMVRLK